MLSGSGRTLQNFIDLSKTGRLKADITGVISSRSDAYGLERARKAGIPACVVDPGRYDNSSDFSSAITSRISPWNPDLVVMAGFLSLYLIPPRLENRVMNIHPALLPAFGGKGCYGERVHRAVLEYGCKVSGCTVHFANNKYDHGPIILQKAVAVKQDDDVHSLAERVFEAEKELYPRAINLFAGQKLRIDGRVVKVLGAVATQSG